MDETAEVARWALTESKKLQETDPMGSPLETQLLETWEAKRPKMVARLAKYGALEALAHVLVDRFLRSETANLEVGLPPTDATEQAGRDWLMSEPEDEEAEDETN